VPKPISQRAHGVLDYATVVVTAAAPTLLAFPKSATALAYTLAGGYAGLSLATAYPLGAAPVVPFKAHGLAEGALGLALPAMPWLFGFAGHRAARNFCFALTAITAVVAALTDWDGVARAGRDGPGAAPA
jgi:hypothetical protein